MKNFKILCVIFSFLLGGCGEMKNGKSESGGALPGTETAIVGIYFDKNGYPQSNVEKVAVYPGQRIIFAGPEKFEIFFKDEKSPISEKEVRSSNGIIIIEIPKDIFENQQRTNAQAIKQLVYRYGIRANGKTTDPTIIIDKRNGQN